MVGERGPEAVIPLSSAFGSDVSLSGFSSDTDALAKVIIKAISESPQQKISLEIPLIINGREFAKAAVEDIDKELAKRQNRQIRLTGRVRVG
jgi:hypothetical protein